MHQLGLDIVLIFILNDQCMKSNTDFMGPITMQLGQSNILTHYLTILT